LLDENLPFRLRFQPEGRVIHSVELGRGLSDAGLWDYAKKHHLAIVTKDSDFSDHMLMTEPPPWVVHLRFGNLPRREFHSLLERIWPRVQTLLLSSKLVNVYEHGIEAISSAHSPIEDIPDNHGP
jgi:predicted nuclease of predicted toxin-antitoxin system